MRKTKRTLVSKSIISSLVLLTWSVSCSDKPKVIHAVNDETYESPFEVSKSHKENIGASESVNQNSSNVFHKVVILESLPTTKYVYLKVKEGAKTYWIATKKIDVQPGSTYYYRNGLLKTNFESKEYNRTFEELYLVSSIVPESHGTNSEDKQSIEMHGYEGDEKITTAKPELSQDDTSITTIAELVKNKESLSGSEVTLKGRCTKVNTKIMGRNWIHLKDGSMDGYDLVVTSMIDVPIGDEVTLSGIVATNKDFGSGYYYDVLVENGKLLITL